MKEKCLEVLREFAQGYIEKNIECVDEFVEKMFVEDSPIYYGTAGNELHVGKKNIAELLHDDWLYWGTLSIDENSLYLHGTDDFADFIGLGYLDWTIDNEVKVKATGFELGRHIAYRLRISGSLYKQQDKWKISTIHMSQGN